MARRRYSKQEAINRFRRSWVVEDLLPSDQPGTLDGEILSENEAWSDIAELVEDSLPDKTPKIPDGVRASSAEAIAGTDDNKAVTPAGLAAAIAQEAHEYGQIYTSTGTVTVVLGTSEVKLTGSFHVNGLSSSNIAPDFNDDRITINSVGAYFANFQVAFSGTAAATYDIQVYLDGVAQPQVKTRRKLNAAGELGSCSAAGFINVTGTGMDLELYVNADAGSKNFLMESGQLVLEKLPV